MGKNFNASSHFFKNESSLIWGVHFFHPSHSSEIMFYLQVDSYYKMLSSFFVPIISIEGTTGPIWLKFCMRPPRGITRWITEGFLDIRSGGPDMGYPRSPRGGPKILKICFPIFSSFSTGMGTLSSKSLVYVKISASFSHFNVQGGGCV